MIRAGAVLALATLLVLALAWATSCAEGTDDVAVDGGLDAGRHDARPPPTYDAVPLEVPDWPRTCPPACPAGNAPPHEYQ